MGAADLLCPVGVAMKGCGNDEGAASATLAEVEAVLKRAGEDKVIEQLALLRRKKEDKTLSECPSCGTLCPPPVRPLSSSSSSSSSSSTSSASDPTSLAAPLLAFDPARVTCGHCDAVFCLHHSWAHRDDTRPDACQRYERRILDEQRANASAFGLKNCPNQECKQPTIKNGGCNHVSRVAAGQSEKRPFFF